MAQKWAAWVASRVAALQVKRAAAPAPVVPTKTVAPTSKVVTKPTTKIVTPTKPNLVSSAKWWSSALWLANNPYAWGSKIFWTNIPTPMPTSSTTPKVETNKWVVGNITTIGWQAIGNIPGTTIPKSTTGTTTPTTPTKPITPTTTTTTTPPKITTPKVTPTTPTTPVETTPGPNTAITPQEMADNMETASEIEVVKAANKAKADALALETIHNQQVNISNDIANQNAQMQLDKAADQLDALKQSSAYLWQQWQPWVSSVHLNAIAKQITDAQTTFDRMVKMQADTVNLQQLWIKYDATKFAQDMTAISDKLHTQVQEAQQNAINAFMVDGKDIDTMEEFNFVKDTIRTRLDKSIANLAISNSAERAQILSQYQAQLEFWEMRAKNKNVVNEAMSSANKYYTDGNGNAMKDSNWVPIPYVWKPLYSWVDSTTGNFVAIYQNADGSLKAQYIPTWDQWGTTETIIKPSWDMAALKIWSATKYFDAVAAAPLQNAIDQMKAAWMNVIVWSWYRTNAEQTALYNKYLAWTWWLAAKPGTSKHETWMAVDMYAGKDPKTGKLIAPTQAMIDYMAKNGREHQALAWDSWHFEYKWVAAWVQTWAGMASFAKLSQQDKDIAKQVSEYDYDPSRLSMRSGKSAENTKAILNAAYELNPNYSMGDYANMKAYKATWNKAIAPAGNLGRVGTAINHLAELQTVIGDLKGQSNLQIQNKIVNGVKQALGRPWITSFKEAAAAVSSELAGAYKGNASPSESDRQERSQTIGVELSPAQFEAWIDTAAQLLYGKTSTDAFNYQQTIGKKPKSIFNNNAVNFLQSKWIDLGWDYDLSGNEVQTPSETINNDPLWIRS